MNEPISLASRIAMKADVLCRDLDGELVLLDLRTGVYFSLDPLGTRVWTLAQEGRSLADVVQLVVEEYEVTPERFSTDLLSFVSSLREKGLVEVDAAAPR
jgi:Coenzyme PQQ synthesis protein D (PqqD)